MSSYIKQERDESLRELRKTIDAELDAFIAGCAREDVDIIKRSGNALVNVVRRVQEGYHGLSQDIAGERKKGAN